MITISTELCSTLVFMVRVCVCVCVFEGVCVCAWASVHACTHALLPFLGLLALKTGKERL